MKRWQKIGLLAGGGNLPFKLVESCLQDDAPFFVVRLKSYADDALSQYPNAECSIAEIGKLIRILKENECDAICMVGNVSRPNFAALKPDWRGAALVPKVLSAARKGDGAILDVLVETFEAEGFLVIGAEEIAKTLEVPLGAISTLTPNETDMTDMRKAAEVVRVLGPFDIGQGTVVRNGHVLAVEAAEGTDNMLQRCAELPDDMRGFEPDEIEGLRGVLLKKPKPGQELRVDLPTIGVETVLRAKKAELAGIAVESGAALIVDIEDVRAIADREGLFIYGFELSELNN